jgi:hypothetical protein
LGFYPKKARLTPTVEALSVLKHIKLPSLGAIIQKLKRKLPLFGLEIAKNRVFRNYQSPYI